MKEHKIVRQSSSISQKHGGTVKADEFSAWTLILNNKENQEEFLFLTRTQARRQALILSLITLVIGVLTLLMCFVVEEEENIMFALQIGMLVVSPSLATTILVLMAKRKLWLVELTNIVFAMVFGIVCLAINALKITGELNDMQRQQ